VITFTSLPPVSAGLLPDLLFDPEDGGDMFPRKFRLSPTYTALQPRRPHTSASYFGGPGFELRPVYRLP
jgi:hypothetical protein